MKFQLGILTNFLGYGNKAIAEPPQINGQPVKIVEVGVAGTQIYGGYLNEDYLAQQHGRQWMDKQDQMRRSDAQIRMLLSCIKLPIKSSKWTIKKEEETPEAELQKLLYEKALFKDIGKSFKRLVGEILTCVDFGFSLLEVTYQAKIDDPDLGSYNTLKALSWRSQRTIERWVVDNTGQLQYVNQISYGDTGRIDNMDARFLVHFAPDMEGDNYEGISTQRFIYGNWLRKNHYLKLMASGIEKSAIPVPIVTVPSGKETSPEYENMKKVLKAYTSNQMNYITVPAGWTIDTIKLDFDVEKMKSALDFENHEMMNSALASFLMLGQGGTAGNKALGATLSDFFKMSQQYLADHITEQINEKVFQKLLDMNFGPNTKRLVSLECDGLAEKADVAFSEIIKNLTGNVAPIKPDEKLENYLRDEYDLPEKDSTTEDEYKPTPAAGSDNMRPQLAESRWRKKPSKAILKKG